MRASARVSQSIMEKHLLQNIVIFVTAKSLVLITGNIRCSRGGDVTRVGTKIIRNGWFLQQYVLYVRTVHGS